MERAEFERLRDLAGKLIRGDIRFAERRQAAPLYTAEDIRIENSEGADLRMNITYNPKVGSKIFNVHIPQVGPICRLCVDGVRHRPAGRSHKHAVETSACVDNNLPSVTDRTDLSGQGMRALFTEFCRAANIVHEGVFAAPDEGV